MDLIYLDNNATTRPADEVVQAMLPFYTQWWGNPSSVHRFGQRARQAMDEARSQVAALIGCQDSEILFTGGGTEAVNSIVRGLLAARSPRKKIVTSTVEHSATRELCNQLERDGAAEIVRIGVDEQGHLDLHEFEAALRDDPALVSLIWANNETGVLFPIERIAAMCREKKVPLHCDGTQAVGKVPVDVVSLGVDAMSFAPHKFHGPKGIGVLFARRGLRFRPLVIGGTQEKGRRGGTENVPAIVGTGVAAQLALDHLDEAPHIAALRDRLEQGILQSIDNTHVNGDPSIRVPNTTNIGFAQLEAEAILLLLSEKGICASAGAACASGSLEPSPILLAMGIDPKIAHGAVRFSVSRYTTEAEIDQTLAILPGVIEKLRGVLPVARA